MPLEFVFIPDARTVPHWLVATRCVQAHHVYAELLVYHPVDSATPELAEIGLPLHLLDCLNVLGALL